MTVAFGTSIPSSTTVVATSTSRRPRANARSVCSLRVGGQRAVQQADARRAQLARSSRACWATAVTASSRRADFAHRADDERLAALGDRLAQARS